MTLTAERVRERMHYDPETGIATWRVNYRRARAGATVGTKSGRYLLARLDGVLYLLHRVIWLYVHGAMPGENRVVDHMDGDGGNNRLANLREVHEYVNQQDRRRAKKSATSGAMGVYWHERDQRWIATIRPPRSTGNIEIGRFHDRDKAAAAYIEAKRQIHAGCTI